MSPRGCKDESKRSESDEGNEVREKDRKANTSIHGISFSTAASATVAQEIISPPLCLFLRLRISVLAFGYLKKKSTKEHKAGFRLDSRCRMNGV